MSLGASLHRPRLLARMLSAAVLPVLGVALALGSPAPAHAGTSADEVVVFGSNRDGDADIYVSRPGAGEPVKLTRNRAADYYPRFSPDGGRIVFVSDRDGDDEIYVMNADGTGTRQLTRNGKAGGMPVSDTTPDWSPDGTRIVFASNRAGGEHELFVMEADGSDQRRLTRTKRWVINIAPVFSPDGTRIAFSSNRAGYFNLEIYTMRADGKDLRRLTRTVGSHDVLGDDNMPAYSPDGTRITFASTRDQQSEVYVMNADGSGQTRLTRRLDTDEVSPRFSPAGDRIVLTSVRPNGVSTLVTIHADGSDLRRLRGGFTPDWRRFTP